MQTLQPLSNRYSIPTIRDEKDTEFEVQAAFFTMLQNLNFDARGEVCWRAGRERGKRRECCRFDIAIYRNGKPWHIVEVKSGAMNHKNGVEATRQGQRYRHFGVPVTFVYGYEDLDPLADYLLAENAKNE